ncbi:MAG: succinate dehydrogenase cytochrome b subunit [Planctomycetota bacterium]|jgi:succinate dehydrogenase / fumarate reductase cytochrome b subunit
MARFARLYRSSIGAKSVMAVTGLLLFLFLIGHLAGNLLIFKGSDAINSYAQGLQNLGPGLWIVRLGLLAVFVAHIWTAIKLTAENKEARPVRYQKEDTLKATWASRYMMLTGMVVLAFVVYHLLHFTFHQFGPRGTPTEVLADGTKRVDVYTMVIKGFRDPMISITYLIAHALLLSHLLHGIQSLGQTLGWNHDAVRPLVKKGLPGLAVLVVLGKVCIPLSILLGFIGENVK